MTLTTSPDTTLPGAACPRCATTVIAELGAAPWCPSCEWNLDRYEPDRRRPELGWVWLDRWTHRMAYRLTTAQYADLVGRPVGDPGAGPARLFLLVAGAVLLAVVAAMFGLGAY